MKFKVRETKPGKYGPPQVYTAEEEVKVGIFTDLVVELTKVFEG